MPASQRHMELSDAACPPGVPSLSATTIRDASVEMLTVDTRGACYSLCLTLAKSLECLAYVHWRQPNLPVLMKQLGSESFRSVRFGQVAATRRTRKQKRKNSDANYRQNGVRESKLTLTPPNSRNVSYPDDLKVKQSEKNILLKESILTSRHKYQSVP